MLAPTLLNPAYKVDPKRKYSLQEWQLLEQATGERYEFHKGTLIPVRAMAGGSGTHALIGANVIGLLFRLITQPQSDAALARCGVYSSDLQLMLEFEERYVYPDAAVICGPPEYDYAITTAARNPLLVVEVLSPSSAAFDTGAKFDYYAALPSLRDYVLVSQDGPRVEIRSRADVDAPWTIDVSDGLKAEIELPSLGQALALQEVYRLVDWIG